MIKKLHFYIDICSKSDDNNFSSIFKESIGDQDGKTEQGISLENAKEDVLPEEALAYLSGL